MTKLELHVSSFNKQIIGEIFDEILSISYLFSKLEGEIFGKITVYHNLGNFVVECFRVKFSC